MKRLIVDYGLMYNRIALLDNQILMELYIEDVLDKSHVGNIYLGKVVNVVKAMSAAFVDIGTGKNAYLPWHEGIKNGHEYFVQVTRDPVGDKGATVSLDISLSGQYLVVLPQSDNVMVSKKIRSEEDRTRLMTLVADHLDMGAVVRTEAKDVDEQILLDELAVLKEQWETIAVNRNRILKHRLVYEDYAFEKLIQKEYLPMVDEMFLNDVNHAKLFKSDKVRIYKEPYPIYEHFRVEEQILSSLNREVTLHQGSVITIDETEALTAIDVNSAGFTGSSNKEETFLQVNLAAAKEIARQIRLRNISGIIIIDFINMKQKGNYDILIEALKKHFARDRSQPQIHGVTSLGLMEITRKKNRKSLKTQLVNTCEVCGGAGYYVSETIYFKKFIEKIRVLMAHTGKDCFEVKVSEGMLELLSKELQDGISYLEYIESSLEIDILLEFDESLDGYQFKTTGK